MTEDNSNKFENKLSLEQTGLSKRWPSWLLAGIILLLFLVIPLISLTSNSWSDLLRGSPLPSDNSWISGELSSVHQTPELNQNCQACHVDSFEMVQDEACLACHSAIEQHIDLAQHSDVHLDQVRCASCHREHDEPANLVRRDDQLCVDCHLDLSSTKNSLGTKLVDVGGFGAEYRDAGKAAPHPSYKISTLVPEGVFGNTTWRSLRTELTGNSLVDKVKEQSNLIFPHDVHLDPAGIDSPAGNTQLVCNDCHVTDDAGQLMQPITMENNCRSCHTLVFDPNAPAREVPHGKPDLVLLVLEEYYARQFLTSELGRDPSPQELRDFVLRRPGGAVKQRAQQQAKLSGPWSKARSVAEEIFTRTTCKTCHEISANKEQVGTTNDSPTWHVAPVRLTKHWMPKSVFDHISHRTTDCGVCHDASNSKQSSDILLPDQEVCEACHTGASSHANKTPTSCIACHEFHRKSLPLWDTDYASSLGIPSNNKSNSPTSID